jgi:hypothetical protein
MSYITRKLTYNTVKQPDYNLDPWFITGLADSSGSFFFLKSEEVKFQIELHSLNLPLLKSVKAYFKGIGFIKKNKGVAEFTVSSLRELAVIIDHFDSYPLITRSKSADYILFKRTVKLKILRREHLKIEGIQEILNLKASLNLGLSEADHEAFPETRPVARPLVEPSSQIIPDPEWVSGFVSAEGCFYVGSYKVSDRSLGVRIVVRLEVAQHTRDELLMSSLVSYLGCGKYEKRNSRDLGYYKVTKFADIQNPTFFPGA